MKILLEKLFARASAGVILVWSAGDIISEISGRSQEKSQDENIDEFLYVPTNITWMIFWSNS